MSARLDLARTEVSANDATAAAIQVEALRPGDAITGTVGCVRHSGYKRAYDFSVSFAVNGGATSAPRWSAFHTLTAPSSSLRLAGRRHP